MDSQKIKQTITLLIKFYAVQDRGLGGVPPQTPVSKSAEGLINSVFKDGEKITSWFQCPQRRGDLGEVKRL